MRQAVYYPDVPRNLGSPSPSVWDALRGASRSCLRWPACSCARRSNPRHNSFTPGSCAWSASKTSSTRFAALRSPRLKALWEVRLLQLDPAAYTDFLPRAIATHSAIWLEQPLASSSELLLRGIRPEQALVGRSGDRARTLGALVRDWQQSGWGASSVYSNVAFRYSANVVRRKSTTGTSLSPESGKRARMLVSSRSQHPREVVPSHDVR